jgi:hypothetical protein
MRGMTTIIITKCDAEMERGDYFQNPKEDSFNVSEESNIEDEEDQEEGDDSFWVKIMKPGQPFKFAEDKMLLSKPICWTTKPKKLSKKLDMPAETIEKT